MPTNTQKLLQEVCINVLKALVIFGLLTAFASLAEKLLSISILHWEDTAFILSIPASICGVAYILTVKNPQNFYGFYLGIAMAILLAIQYWLMKSIQLSGLYIFIFIPIYFFSISQWRSKNTDESSHFFIPTYLSLQQIIVSTTVFIFLLALVYVLTSVYIHKNALDDDVLWKLLPALQMVSSLLANFLMVFKKVDAWIYWVIFSLAGLIFSCLQFNLFSIALFSIFLIVNTIVLVNWSQLAINNKHEAQQ